MFSPKFYTLSFFHLLGVLVCAQCLSNWWLFIIPWAQIFDYSKNYYRHGQQKLAFRRTFLGFLVVWGPREFTSIEKSLSNIRNKCWRKDESNEIQFGTRFKSWKATFKDESNEIQFGTSFKSWKATFILHTSTPFYSPPTSNIFPKTYKAHL
jgi:hypothetical protein